MVTVILDDTQASADWTKKTWDLPDNLGSLLKYLFAKHATAPSVERAVDYKLRKFMVSPVIPPTLLEEIEEYLQVKPENKALLDSFEVKGRKAGIRKVQTPAGEKRFGQPIGSIIIRDGEPPLKHISITPDSPNDSGFEVVTDAKGNRYEVGWDETNETWVATAEGDWNDILVDEAASEEETLRLLDDVLSRKRVKGRTVLGSLAEEDTEDERQGEQLAQMEARANELRKTYTDKRKKTYNREIAGYLKNYDDNIKNPGVLGQVVAEEYLRKAEEVVKGKKFQERIASRQARDLEKRRSELRERAKRIAQDKKRKKKTEEPSDSPVLKARKRNLSEQKKRLKKMKARATALKPFTQSGPDYVRGVVDNLDRYNDALKKTAGEERPEFLRSLIDSAEYWLKQAESSADYHKQAERAKGGQRANVKIGDLVQISGARESVRVVRVFTNGQVEVEGTVGKKKQKRIVDGTRLKVVGRKQ